MQKLFIPILIFSLSFLYCNSYAVLGRQVLVDGWLPVNPSDPLVIELAEFAVDIHNRRAKESLNTVENNYQAVVWDKPSHISRELISFTGPI
ncbi:hypothetical protein Tco_1298320 [Tanacetum coccineum]